MADEVKTVKADFTVGLDGNPVGGKSGPCDEAIWLASLLMTNDRYFAAEISSLVGQRNQIENLRKSGLYSDKVVNERLHTIDEKINLFIEAKLLAGQGKYFNLGAEARSKLIKHLEEAGWSMERDYMVLSSIIDSDIINKQELTTLLADGPEDAELMIAKFDDAFAKYVIAKDTMRETQGIKKELSDKLASTEKKHMNTSGKTGGGNKAKTKPAKEVKPKQDRLVEPPRDVDIPRGQDPDVKQQRLFRRESAITDGYETITEEEVRRIVYKYFDSDEVTVIFANNLRTPEGQKAFGEYYKGMLKFAKSPKKYTPEHEVVHAYMDLFMTEGERNELYLELVHMVSEKDLYDYANSLGIPFYGNRVEVMNEFLADLFVEHVKKRSTLSGRLSLLFDELWNRVKRMFGRGDSESKIGNMFNDIIKKRRRNPRKTVGQVRLNHTQWDGANMIKNFNFSDTYQVRLINESALGGGIQRNNKSNPSNVVAERQIAKTILGYDTNINWFNLSISIDNLKYIDDMLEKGGLDVVYGLYNDTLHHIFIGEYDTTVQHEMTHALDRIWGMEFFGDTGEYLTEIMNDARYRCPRENLKIIPAELRKFFAARVGRDEELVDLLVEFFEIYNDSIMKGINSTAKSKNAFNRADAGYKAYLQIPTERFARFGEAFIKRVEFGEKMTDDTGKSWARTNSYDEIFKEEHFKKFKDWLSHMADARERGKLETVDTLGMKDKGTPLYKRVDDDFDYPSNTSYQVEGSEPWDTSNISYWNGVRIWGVSRGNNVVDALTELRDRNFRNGKSLINIAAEYDIPIFIADDFIELFSRQATDLPEGSEIGALTHKGPIGTMIFIKRQMDRGEGSHELFHAIFNNNVPVEVRGKILEDTMNLYNLSKEKANEMLADLFMDYYHTGKFELPKKEHLDAVPGLKERILKVFKTIKNWLLGVDKYGEQLQKLYDDILDLKFVDEDRLEQLDLYGLDAGEDYVNGLKVARINGGLDNLYEELPMEASEFDRITYNGLTSYDILANLSVDDYYNKLGNPEISLQRAAVAILTEAEKNPLGDFMTRKRSAKDNFTDFDIDWEAVDRFFNEDNIQKWKVKGAKETGVSPSGRITEQGGVMFNGDKEIDKIIKDGIGKHSDKWIVDRVNEYLEKNGKHATFNENRLRRALGTRAHPDDRINQIIQECLDDGQLIDHPRVQQDIVNMINDWNEEHGYKRDETVDRFAFDVRQRKLYRERTGEYKYRGKNIFHKDDFINSFIGDHIKAGNIDKDTTKTVLVDLTNDYLEELGRGRIFTLDDLEKEIPNFKNKFNELNDIKNERYTAKGTKARGRTKSPEINKFIDEHIADGTIDEPRVQAELDKMLRDWQLKNGEEPTGLGEEDYYMVRQPMGKVVDVNGSKGEVQRDITMYNIKGDPVLQAEYNSRIESVKMLQQLNNNDIETLRNFGGFFAADDGLFGTAKVTDLGDSIIEIGERYLRKGENINTMTVSDLRKRMQLVQEQYKNAHKQKNILAQMRKDREDGNKIIELFQVKDVTTEGGISLKKEDRITKEGITFMIRDGLDGDNTRQTPNVESETKATKVDTSKGKGSKGSKGTKGGEIPEGEGTSEGGGKKVAETRDELEKRGNKEVDTNDGPNPDINDPATKEGLSDEAEQTLKEEIKKDVDQVKKGESPSNVASADDIWKEFWERSDDVKEREKALNNYLLGKIYLGESDDVLESALKWLNGENLKDYGRLTLKQIDKIDNLQQLEQIVFTHIGDLIYDKSLRSALKDKQYELWTNATTDAADNDSKVISKARSMQKTAEFLEAGGQYTDVTLYDKVGRTLKSIFDIDPNVNNRDLYDEFTTAVTNFSSNRKLKTTKVGGVDMDATDLVKGIYAISWDDLVKDVASLRADPTDQLKIAAKKLFDIGDEKMAKNAEKRINDLFNSITPQDLKDSDVTKLAYATTSAVKIDGEITDDNVVFYNYRDGLYAGDPQTTYGEFFDELARQNSMVIDSEHNMKEVFRIGDIPSNVEYIIVNDINRWDDKELKDFVYGIPEDSRPKIIYPRGGQMGNYYVENGKLKFKTTSNQLYKEITRDASAQTLGAFARNIEDVTDESMEALEDKALEYFRTIMGLNKEGAPVNKKEYKERVINNLRVMTGLPISSDMDVYNPQSTWKMANDIIRYQLGATGRYTKIIKDVDEEISNINSKFESNREGLFNEIKAIVGGNDELMKKNANEIKDAYINYATAQSIETKIWAKGTLMALCNGGEYSQITIDLFNGALRKDDFVSVLGPVIYGEREYTQSEIDALNRFGDDILSSYIFDLGSNIIKNGGYSLPLVSPASTIRKLLKGEDIMNEDFVQAFIKKNGLQENPALIEGILRDALPDELDMPIPTELLTNKGISKENYNIVVEEVPNVIIPTNYNQLLAVVKKSGSKGGGITWEEESIIEGILENYYNAVKDAIDAGTMTPTLAQQLKLQAGWALDRAEQDLIIAKYDSYLTLEQRNGLMGGKYKLRIATTEEELDSVKRGNQDIINGYRARLGEMGRDWIKGYNNAEQAKKDLIERGKVMTTIDGKVITMNVHDLLIQDLQTLPDGVKGIFKNFEKLTVNDIRGIPYEQAYAIIKAIDLAKNASARGNLYARLMYKQNPNLANISFFSRYTLNSDGVPYAIQRNAAKLVDSSISDGIDTMLKQNIMLDISQVMKTKGRLSEEDLAKIIKKELSSYDDNELLHNHYTNMFMAYTYLTNIPKDVKNIVNQMLDTQLKEIKNELKGMDNDFFEGVLNSRITLADGTEMALRDLLEGDIDLYKQNLFIEKGDDGVYREVKQKEATSKELGWTNEDVLNYADSMYSILNNLDQVGTIERKMNTVILGDARQILNKYTTTKRLIDFDYLIGGANDLLRNLIKTNAFSGWGKLWGDGDLISKAWGWVTGKTFFNKNNWNTIREYYYTYYRQSLDALEKMKVSNDLQATALEMAKYFKRLEETLGSADGVRGASVNTKLNRAFGKMGTVVLNVNSESQVYSLMEAIGNNQILKFFKFARKGDGAYFDLFSDMNLQKLRGTGTEYLKDIELGDVKRFNELFNSNFNRGQYSIIMQALGGYYIGGQAVQWVNWILRGINSSSTLARTIMSYPFQLLTIAPQSIAYNFKANAFKRELGIEGMYDITRVREANDILTSEYVELNPKGWMLDKLGIKNILAKYSGDEVDKLLREGGAEMDDSVVELFGRAYDYASNKYRWQQFVQLFDATRDNANNIIDALMAQKFKNLAFVKALKYNNVMPFENARAFEIFMKNDNIPQSMKEEVLDAVKIYSGRIFKDMLGTGFSGLDKAYGADSARTILIGLMNTMNFRGAWGLNMFRQTIGKIFSVMKLVRFAGDRKAIGQAIDFIKKTPEFSDLSTAMFNDLFRMWRLARFSDNGKRPDDESEADFMDFCEWVGSNINLVSQQWQGIMSFGPIRPLVAMGEAIRDHQSNPEYYGDPYGIGALINTWVSNIGRNWKPAMFVLNALRVAQSDGKMSSAWAYTQNHWHELSAGTLRYMIEEGYNDYGSNTPLVYEVGGIPSIFAGDQWAGSDTAYLYKMRQAETWEYIQNIRAGKDGYDTMSLFTQLMNYSKLLNLGKESIKLVGAGLGKDDWKSSKTAYTLDDMDEAYADLPLWKEWRTTGMILPKHEVGYDDYYNSIINVFTEGKNPGGSKFFEGLSNFKEYGHVSGKKNEANYFDTALEEFYTRIAEKNPNAFDEILNNKQIHAMMASSDTAGAIQLELSWAMKYLKEFEGDPEYNKYAAIIYKGVMSNSMYNELNDFAARKTNEYKADGYLPKKKDKFSANEIKDNKELYMEFKKEFVDKHWDDLMVADVEGMQSAMFKFLVESDRSVSDKFFVEKEIDGEKKYYMKSALKSQAQQLIDFERFMNEGNWEAAIAQGTQLTKTFSYDHIVSANTAAHIINRIKDADNLSDEMKLEAMTEFASNNLDAFAWNSDLYKDYPEIYEEVKKHYNELNYQVNQDLINAANDYALSLSSDKDGSKGGKGSGLSLKTKSLSEALRKNQQATGGSRRAEPYTMTWMKAPIIDPTKIFVEDSKPLKINFTSKGYTPKTNLGGAEKQQPTAKPVKVNKVKVKEKDIEVI